MRLTPGELKVMGLLWHHGELTPPQLMELYPEPIKNPALRSYLTILLDKGHVRRRREGKAYVYAAVTPQRQAFSEMVKRLADAVGDGSLRSLLLFLAKEEKLSHADLDEIREAAGLEPHGSPNPSQGKANRKRSRKGAQ